MVFIGKSDLRSPLLGRRLRLGFIGGGKGGLVGRWHLAGARLSNHWEIVAGALSSDPDNAHASAAEWMIAPDRSYSDWNAMATAEAARADGIEAVSIVTPNWTHHRIATAFLKAGIDVILDKPMTTTVSDAQELVELQRATDRLVIMTYPYAHHAMVRQAKHMIRNGAVGTVRQAHVEYVQEWATGPFSSEARGAMWRQDPEKVGRASATGDIGTHAYHLLHTMTGQDIDRLRAEFHTCGAPKAMEDTAYITFRLKNDAPGILWVTQAAPGQYCGLRIRVWGDKGGLEWDQEKPEVLRYVPLGEQEQIFVRGHGSGMLPEAERLIHLPRGHGEALVDAWANLYAEAGVAIAARRAGYALPKDSVELSGVEDGLKGMLFIDACADSHESGGSWISIKR
ncbi:Gfo/Idh/MocA family oxidoreductase [Sinorhizobium sp. BJ1]|uniref:Gfo/Idh/MocA family protein n=1 Tax=Sinorhizobium sp. BJ1 TaxID=2035455 RepID=UPI000BE7BBF5|nr:Gfo/Idh/MocA family oxidoreductase [Sinorhizobium sp. BJ1]PDT81306.1 oxidoreductase [Sinorhizobium sp. BJ1]